MNKTKPLLYTILVFFFSCSVSKKLTYDKYDRKILFSGYEWVVKKSDGRAGSGYNYFTDDTSSVWVDNDGYLHLRLRRKHTNWYCTEVIALKTMGYGNYEFIIESALNKLDRNVVLGLFTWDDKKTHNHREIDIEFARWDSQTSKNNTQYVVQPYNNFNNLHRFSNNTYEDVTKHSFFWNKDSIYFRTCTAENNNPNDETDLL